MDFLGLAAGVVHGSTDAAAVAKAENLRDLFGNVRTTASHIAARGLLADLAGPSLAYQAAFTIGVAINVNPYESEFRVSGYGPLAVIPNESTYLVRTAAAAIPEPATLSLLGLGLAGLGRGAAQTEVARPGGASEPVECGSFSADSAAESMFAMGSAQSFNGAWTKPFLPAFFIKPIAGRRPFLIK